MYWLARLTRELLECRAGRRALTDRDHLAEKRARTVGALLEELFGQAMAIFWKKLEEYLRKVVNKIGAAERLDVAKAVASMRSVVTSFIRQAVATGNLSKGRNGFTRVYELSKSELSAISGPRHTNAFLARAGKQLKPRQLHGSHYGFVCPAESPGGDGIGLLKSPAASAEITSQGSRSERPVS